MDSSLRNTVILQCEMIDRSIDVQSKTTQALQSGTFLPELIIDTTFTHFTHVYKQPLVTHEVSIV